MTERQKNFVEAYLGEAHFNATKAAEIAGYSAPKQRGHEIKKHPDVSAAIAKRLQEATLTKDEVLHRLSDHAKGTLKHFIRQETFSGEVVVDLSTDAAEEHLHLLKRVKTKKRSGGKDEARWEELETELELHDPQSALVHIGRHYKLFTDKTEHSGPGGGPIEFKQSYDELRKLSPEELSRLHRETIGDTP